MMALRIAANPKNAWRSLQVGPPSATISSFRSKSTVAAAETASEVQKPELKHVRKLPFLGSVVPQFSDIPGDMREVGYPFFPKMREKYGDFYTMGLPSLGNPDCIYQTVHIITDPREMVPVIRGGGTHPSGLVEAIWVNRKWNKARNFAAGAILDRGSEWKRFRNFMQTDLLHPESARGYVPGMIKAAELASAGAPASKKELNAYLGRCAFDLFSTTMFGELTQVADPTTPTDPENERFAKVAAASLGTSIFMMLNPYEVVMNKLGISTERAKFCFESFDATYAIADAKIEAFIERRERNELTENERNSYLFRALDRQLEPESQLTREEVKQMCFSMLFAAVDTTAGVMGWLLFHVARCEEVQQRLYEELKTAVDKFGDNGQLTLEVISPKNVPYLHAIFRESNRLTPAGPIFSTKQIMKEEGIEVNNTLLKKGDVVSFEGYSLGMDPKLVDDPEEFNPDRWSPEAVAARKGTPKEIIDHPFLKDPFSQGARKCPGSRVASNEMHVLLSQLVLDWKITSPIKEMKDVKYEQKTTIEVDMPELSFEARA